MYKRQNVANSTDQEDMEIDHTDLVLKLINSDGDALVDSSTKYYLLIDDTAIDNSNSSKSFAGVSDKNTYTYTTISANNCGAITGKAKYWKGKGASSSNVKVYRDNSLVETLTTDSFGVYYFYPTQTGTYHVEFIKPNSSDDANLSAIGSASIPSGSSSSAAINSGRWVRNIEITTSCEFHTDIDLSLIHI